jgi:hypothetical protein
MSALAVGSKVQLKGSEKTVPKDILRNAVYNVKQLTGMLSDEFIATKNGKNIKGLKRKAFEVVSPGAIAPGAIAPGATAPATTTLGTTAPGAMPATPVKIAVGSTVKLKSSEKTEPKGISKNTEYKVTKLTGMMGDEFTATKNGKNITGLKRKAFEVSSTSSPGATPATSAPTGATPSTSAPTGATPSTSAPPGATPGAPGATPTTNLAPPGVSQINTQGVMKGKVTARGQFLLLKDDKNSKLYEIISTTQPTIGSGTYTLKDASGDELVPNLSEKDLKEKYEVAKLQFKAGNTIDDLKRENFPDLDNIGEEEFKTILKNCMADGFEFGFGLSDKDFNNNNNNIKKLNGKNTYFIIYLPYNNTIIKDNVGKIKSKYTNANKIRLYGIPTDLLLRFDQIQSTKSYSNFSYYKDKPPSSEEDNNDPNGTKFTARNLKRKSNMIANIIATNRFLERNNINIGNGPINLSNTVGAPASPVVPASGGANNIDKLKLDRYFTGKYSMTQKRALHNIISNILLKEVIRPGRLALMKIIINKLVDKYKVPNNTKVTKYAVLDSIIYIIDKLLLFNVNDQKPTPRKELLDLVQAKSADLGDPDSSTFITNYITQALTNQAGVPPPPPSPEELAKKKTANAKKAWQNSMTKEAKITGQVEIAGTTANKNKYTADLEETKKQTKQLKIAFLNAQKEEATGNAGPTVIPGVANSNIKPPGGSTTPPAIKPPVVGPQPNSPNGPPLIDNKAVIISKGGYKLKKTIKKPKGTKKVKKITTYTKAELEKIARKHKISLKKRDGSKKIKEELFKSLKRKGLV